MRIGFDNDKYLKTQSEHIRERIAQFGGKLYLEFGGKLFDDYHASRVLPGFHPDSKITMLKELKDQAEKLGLINVRFLGNVSMQELRKLYNIADVSVVPSRREPFGLVALEAMACGIPVVASDQGGLPDFVNKSVGILAKPEDPVDLSDKIEGILDIEEATDEVSWKKDIAGYARTHYAQDMIIRELEEVYQKALSGC